ncbi:MAG TPA: hypothetical protein VFP32_02115 [Candidatus Saccharimonadales bacterium]|nr:hypothetical protein [Candidatus Saccharimonadales bacterium]
MMHPISRTELWHAQAIVLMAIVLQLSLPSSLRLGPKFTIAILEFALLFAITFTAPRRHSTTATLNKAISTILIGLVSLANGGQLALLIKALLDNSTLPGRALLTGALAIFITNIIMFGLWYWEFDSPGLSGVKKHDSSPQFQFPNMQDEMRRINKWEPTFFDYLYISITNSTAFSPTDTMPLTHATKALMSVQALISLLTVVLVTARAVNILG